MEKTDRQSAADKAIAVLLDGIVALVRKNGIRPDWRGQWFANNKLDKLRRLYEQQGYQTTRLFQVGQIERRDLGGKRDFEALKNQTLLEILDTIEKKILQSKLDQRVGAYLLGRLNAVIADAEMKNTKKGE